MNTQFDGRASLEIQPLLMPGNPSITAVPGQTVYFQCWHRDLMPGTSSNMTDTIAVTFQ